MSTVIFRGLYKDFEKLPQLNDGEILFDVETETYYIYKDKQFQPISIDSNVQMKLLDMNKQIISQMPDLDPFDLAEKIEMIDEFVYTKTNNEFYMIYGKEISYFTVIKSRSKNAIEFAGEVVIDCLNNIGAIKSIEYTEEGWAIECWVAVNDDVTCLYLFPYDSGIVEVQ